MQAYSKIEKQIYPYVIKLILINLDEHKLNISKYLHNVARILLQ